MPAIRCAPSSPGPSAVDRPARGEGGAGDGAADDGGTAAVEFAIVLPVLLLLLFGIIDFGRAMQQQILITEAVREGARVGAISGTTTDVDNKIKSVVGTGFGYTYASSTPTVCGTASTGITDSKVTIAHPFTAVTPIYGIMRIFGPTTSSVTLTATGVMSCVG